MEEEVKQERMPETTAPAENAPVLQEEETLSTEETLELSEVPAERKLFETKPEVVEELKRLMQQQGDAVIDRSDLDYLKQVFYRLHHAERQAQLATFLEAGGREEEFVPEADSDEEDFKALLSVAREQRARFAIEQEKQKLVNLERKLAILEKIKEMVASPEQASASYETFRALQAEWREIKTVPVEKANELWKNYQLYVEQFYDMLKLNHELRAYDLKKNLEIKTALCEKAEKLAADADVVSAFHQLQLLHQEYRDAGPVAKELREEIWQRFKEASSVINKRHASFFADRKTKEEEALQQKTALCEKIESLDLESFTNVPDWEKAGKEMLEVQAEWRTVGRAPRKVNTQIYERFRAACDRFYQQKNAFFKQHKQAFADSLARKTALCEKAEALKESTEWGATANRFIQLQKDWKATGMVSRKASDELWQRFAAACDYFFQKRDEATGDQRKEEQENLAKKQNIIEQLAALPADGKAETQEALQQLFAEWKETGHVPFREKDRLQTLYREQNDRLRAVFQIQQNHRRVEAYKARLGEHVKGGGDELSTERRRLFHAYEAKKAEIATYENNLGFLTVKSKSGNALIDELQKKVEHLKAELTVIGEKIAVIDEQQKG